MLHQNIIDMTHHCSQLVQRDCSQNKTKQNKTKTDKTTHIPHSNPKQQTIKKQTKQNKQTNKKKKGMDTPPKTNANEQIGSLEFIVMYKQWFSNQLLGQFHWFP